ncbi:hypothetical protein [Flavobacterium sp. ACN6]|uniref:hypothetical protein n=1 Tax=Flavobacterium sp. ACN6 TaxID=1920426 RepID=UPI000BB35DA1|nr:hypothetical protein [Flavobacterium sp. ACN6]PBJ15804.1 hypothetical protein BSF42_02070 [Flavobacterium sp. ACN6]
MIDKTLLKKLNFIEIYQFFGGIVGILFMTYLIFTTNVIEYRGPFYIQLIMPFLFFAFCTYSAWVLNKKKYLRGLNLVIISLILQLIGFEIYGIYYTSVNGIAVNFTLDLTNDIFTGFDFQFSQFLLAFRESESIFHLKLNLLAIAMLLFVCKILKEFKRSLYSII